MPNAMPTTFAALPIIVNGMRFQAQVIDIDAQTVVA